MEEAEKRVLGQFRTRLANEIVVTASFLSAFCEKAVLDEEMTRIVKSEDNYTAKAHRLLELLPKRGPKAFSTLMEILEITNPWLAAKMKTALHEEHNRENKLKSSSSASQAASISGYGSGPGRGGVDNDLRSTAHSFVRSTLTHLTDSEQRTTEKWLSEEMQRERRRQQFRSPHTFRRHPEEFQSCKEVQTDMKGMELQELCEDLMIQLHGVDYIHMSRDLSFKMLQTQISELLQRVQKMDLLFIQCLEKFEDTDRFALSLPDLIERSLMRQKELVRALMEDRRKIHAMTEERDFLERHVRQLEEEAGVGGERVREKNEERRKILAMTEERDFLERHVRQLEEEVDHMLKRQSQSVVHPQQMYLKKRKELYSRYTMTKHAPHDKTKKLASSSSSTTTTDGGGISSRVPDSSLTLPVGDLGEVVVGMGEVVVAASSTPASPKTTRVRFASSTGSRPGTSGHARRRPGTSAVGPKSAMKTSAK
ncbi:hypothetical protein ACOMHN_034383 [Nucella lapillus]